MRAGELTERVVFQRRTAAADNGYGTVEGDFADLHGGLEFPAKIRPARQGDSVIAARLQGVNAYNVWLRSSSETRAITADDRIVWKHPDGDRILNIRGEPDDPEGRNQEIHILAERGVTS